MHLLFSSGVMLLSGRQRRRSTPMTQTCTKPPTASQPRSPNEFAGGLVVRPPHHVDLGKDGCSGCGFRRWSPSPRAAGGVGEGDPHRRGRLGLPSDAQDPSAPADSRFSLAPASGRSGRWSSVPQGGCSSIVRWPRSPPTTIPPIFLAARQHARCARSLHRPHRPRRSRHQGRHDRPQASPTNSASLLGTPSPLRLPASSGCRVMARVPDPPSGSVPPEARP